MDFLSDVWAWFSEASQWRGSTGIPNRMWEHITMSASAIAVAALMALPIGLWLGHVRRLGTLAINVSNVGRAIPSFAILVLALEVTEIGTRPAFIALVALAIPPMITNSYVAISEVPAEVREAARGMGMTGSQLLFRVELPVGMPLVMAGIRTAAVQVVATATLAAVVASGGLGRYNVDGLAQRDNAEVFAGGLMVALLAVATEVGLGTLQRALVPRGLRPRVDEEVLVPRERTSP